MSVPVSFVKQQRVGCPQNVRQLAVLLPAALLHLAEHCAGAVSHEGHYSPLHIPALLACLHGAAAPCLGRVPSTA